MALGGVEQVVLRREVLRDDHLASRGLTRRRAEAEGRARVVDPAVEHGDGRPGPPVAGGGGRRLSDQRKGLGQLQPVARVLVDRGDLGPLQEPLEGGEPAHAQMDHWELPVLVNYIGPETQRRQSRPFDLCVPLRPETPRLPAAHRLPLDDALDGRRKEEHDDVLRLPAREPGLDRGGDALDLARERRFEGHQIARGDPGRVGRSGRRPAGGPMPQQHRQEGVEEEAPGGGA